MTQPTIYFRRNGNTWEYHGDLNGDQDEDFIEFHSTTPNHNSGPDLSVPELFFGAESSGKVKYQSKTTASCSQGDCHSTNPTGPETHGDWKFCSFTADCAGAAAKTGHFRVPATMSIEMPEFS